jgi:omega-hydroxy-beta-dihydromenaquinone-9 sulfotransferase
MPDLIAETASKSPDTRIVFVTGASRSGTTMLARILGNAEGAVAMKELHFFGDLVPFENSSSILPRERAERAVAMTLARHARDYWASGPTREERDLARQIVTELGESQATGDRLFAATMDEIRRMTGARLLVEQTPRNIFYASHLLDTIPDARVVHVMRDPRAVLASQKRRYQLRKLGGRNVPLTEVARLWLNYHPITMVRLWLAATREAMALDGHPRFSIVRYEDLVLDSRQAVETLCRELGLSFQPAMLDVPHWGSSTVRHTSAAGPSRASLEKWREILDGAEIAWCGSRTRPERERFAYPEAVAAPRMRDRLYFVGRIPLHVAGTVLANPRRATVQLKAMYSRSLKSGKSKP